MTSEAVVQQKTELEAAYAGMQIWRNNVGACEDATGRVIRYGLCNDSKTMNDQFKSSDLIGITPVQAYVQSIGWTTLGVFTALEIKASDWALRPSDKRAQAQLRYIELVRQAGGFGGFVTDPKDLHTIIRRA